MKINFLDKKAKIKKYIKVNFADVLEEDDKEDEYEAIRIMDDMIEFDVATGEAVVDNRMLLTFPDDCHSIEEIEKYLELLKFLKDMFGVK